jgi:hypothetical protein
MPETNSPFVIHLNQLRGKTVKEVIVDPSHDLGPVYGLTFTDGTDAWILCDPEGNGPGHLDIVKPQSSIANRKSA